MKNKRNTYWALACGILLCVLLGAASLTDYKGMSVISGTPSGAGGVAVKDNFVYTADRLLHKPTNLLYVDGVHYAQTSAGIQAAVDALPTTGGMIVLPPGDYPMTKNGANDYCVLVNKPVYFVGAGPGFTNTTLSVNQHFTRLKLADNQNCGLFKFDPTTSSDTQLYFGGFEKVEFNGNVTNNSGTGDTRYGVNFDNNSDVLVRHCIFREMGGNTSSACLRFDDRSWGAWVHDNDFEDSTGVTGIKTEAERNFFYANHFRDLRWGVDARNSGDADDPGGWIVDSDFVEMQRSPILFGNSNWWTVQNCYFVDPSILQTDAGAIALRDTTTHVQILNNRIQRDDGSDVEYGIWIEDSTVDYINILDNDFTLASTPYEIAGSANTHGVIRDMPRDGTAAYLDNTGTASVIIDSVNGRIGVGVSDPDAAIEVLNTSTQLKLSYDADSFATFAVDTNDDLTITPSTTGQVIFQPTTDSIDFFQVLDADGGTPVFNVDSTNEGVGILTATPARPLDVNGSVDIRGRLDMNAQKITEVMQLYGATDLILTSDVDGGAGSVRLRVRNTGDSAWLDALTAIQAGNVGIGIIAPIYPLSVDGGISGLEKSADPTEPAEGSYVIWMSDGTGKGDDGDVLIGSQAGGVTKWTTLFDHSAGAGW